MRVIQYTGQRFGSDQDVERQTGIYVNNRGFNGSTYHQGFLGRQIGELLVPRGDNVFRAANGEEALSIGGFHAGTLEWMLANLD